jgi:hypothetical protein
MYLGLIEPYYSSRNNPAMPMCRDTQLVSSRDGEHWFRAGNRQTFIPIGGPGAWDAYMLDIPSNGPFVKGDELWFYYGGRHKHHNYQEGYFKAEDDQGTAAIGLAVLRRDGFVSYDAGSEGGSLLTKPLRFERGSSLHVNVDAHRGEMRVEVVSVVEDPDASLRDWGIRYEPAIEGFDLASSRSVRDNATDHAMAWVGVDDISALTGRLIALRFHLREASLFSFWVE